MPKQIVVLMSVVMALLSFAVSAASSAAFGSSSHAGSPDSLALTDAQINDAIRITGADATVAGLTQGHPYQLAGVAPWTNREGAIIGALALLTFDHSIDTLSGTFLGLNYDCRERTPLPQGSQPYTFTYPDVTSLTVFVDLDHEAVVGTDPTAYVDPASLQHRAQLEKLAWRGPASTAHQSDASSSWRACHD